MSRIQFDFTSFDRRYVIIIAGAVLLLVAVVLTAVLVGSPPQTAEATPTTAPTSIPTRTLTPSPVMPLETPTPAPTASLEPYQYVVQPGDTLLFIIQLFGYRDLAVVPEVISLNGMANENDLRADQVLLIPRQTPTVGPTFTPVPTLAPGLTPSATLEASMTPEGTISAAGCSPENRCVSPDGLNWVHEVVSGETILGIAFAYDSNPAEVLRANSLPQDPIIAIGQTILVPILVSPTPTLTPTGGPGSTATPSSTPAPPALLVPADGAQIARTQPVTLQWVIDVPLGAGQYYLVEVKNRETSEVLLRTTTRSSVYRLPASLQPGVAQAVELQWRVAVVSGSSPESPVVGGSSPVWVFSWSG